MTELNITLKLGFNGQIKTDEEIKEILLNIKSLLVYGNDNGLITPNDSDLSVNKIFLNEPLLGDQVIGYLNNK